MDLIIFELLCVLPKQNKTLKAIQYETEVAIPTFTISKYDIHKMLYTAYVRNTILNPFHVLLPLHQKDVREIVSYWKPSYPAISCATQQDLRAKFYRMSQFQ